MGFRSKKEQKRLQKVGKKVGSRGGIVTGRGIARPVGVGGKIFANGRQITQKEAIERSRQGLPNRFVSDPFPKSNDPRLGVVTGGGTKPFQPTPRSQLIETNTSISLKSPTQAPVVRGRKQPDALERFCKIVVDKDTGKRKRVCRVKRKTKKKKTKKKKLTRRTIADRIVKIPTPARFNL